MIARWKPRTGHSLLGLALGRDRAEAVELKRTNGSAEVRASAEFALEVDPFTGNPEAAGQALRRALDAAGIRERRCAVALPQDIVLTQAVDVPDLPDADRASFLQIEAERGFPQAPEDLMLETSLGERSPSGQQALLLGIPRHQLERLEQVLRAARLHPVSFTLGTTALQPPSDTTASGALALLPSGTSLALQLNHAGAIAALRVIDNAFSGDPAHPECHADHLLRELRITLGQLNPTARNAVRSLRLFGSNPASEAAALTLGPIASRLGLHLERVGTLPPPPSGIHLPSGLPATPALAVAAHASSGQPAPLEFLPPRISAWQQFSQRYASRRLAWAGIAAGTVAGAIALLFLGQQILIWKWQGRWDAIKARVTRLESMQKEIRLYRPWFDESCRSLGILRRLTESFPEDGSVSAKTVEIRPNGRVVCSGTARDTQSWLRMLDQMRNARSITDVQVEQVRGKSPLEFTFNFRWEGPGGS